MSHATAVMFHHFHGESFLPSPGSIDANTLDRLIDRLELDFNLLTAEVFREKAQSGLLASTDTCLTFDDALKSQVEIARPVLEARGLTGHFFVYSSAFEAGGAELEVFRDFRSQHFDSTDTFLEELLGALELDRPSIRGDLNARFPSDYLRQYSFYSHADRQLRYLRDEMLTPPQYSLAMRTLMDMRGIDHEEVRARLMMSVDDLRTLAKGGHHVGLHSHSHPTRIDEFDEKMVEAEYRHNFNFITDTTGVPPRTMSHPCGRYSERSLTALRSMGISVGFIDAPTPHREGDPLCIPRFDHSDLVRRLLT